ncbi:hypothetical protein SAMN03159341_109125 [Paenibacillus sp. 1_12]|uniref:hypothetical protein n=1 Tax=Paenibacillus sp. 1_12 TaxID=1566278 RepID=UPI0008EA18D2|nr:hypothetical protein [Paenibacillus sp. 1_12]SFL74712.1 hypothetical protein SAMN03159341_109125 [Paenibacillus sp. 1_12]
MRTRLLSEQLVKKRFPQLRYVRIHTDGNYSASIYAWNEDLQLPPKEIRSLKLFASDHLHPYICFKVKSYNMVQSDKVPQVQVNGLPDALVKTALNRKLDQDGIITLFHQLFPCGRLTFNRYDSSKGIIHFDFHSNTSIDQLDQELMYNYLYELIPLGSNCEVTFY